MLKVFLFIIAILTILQSFNLYGQKSELKNSLSIQSKEVQSIIQDISKNPLQPVETSSPRATLQNFIENIYKAYKILMLAQAENQSTSGIGTQIQLNTKLKKLKIY